MASAFYLSPLTFIVQYFTNVGVIAQGATIQTNLAGSVSTPQTTYTDSTGVVANANPLTLNGAARAAGVSGALTAFWQPAGVAIDAIFTDTLGETWAIRNIPGINDPSGTNSLQTLLASPASSNGAGAGPVAGVDLIANALKSYDVIADVRAANAPILASGQTLTISVQGGAAINDGAGGEFYWNATSTATDNGTTVLKPTNYSGNGRWLRLFTPPFGLASPIVAAATTDLGALATNVAAISGTSAITSLGASASTARPLWLLTFAAVTTLTYNATSLITPGNQNINTAAGDSAIALYLGSGNWQILAYFRNALGAIVKPSDQSIISSTVLTNDTALAATLAGAATYLVQLRLQMLGVGGTGQGYKVQLTYGGTITGASTGGGMSSTNLTASAALLNLNSALIAAAVANGASADFVSLDFVITTNTGGALNLQFAQNSSSANATKVLAGSQMIITRTA